MGQQPTRVQRPARKTRVQQSNQVVRVQQPNSVAHVLFEYNFERREFKLRFDRVSHATAYQVLNPEGHIHKDRPYDVWLPYPRGITSLRSSSRGTVAMFQNKQAADNWRHKTCLGYVVTLGNYSGVCFKQDWSYAELEMRLGYRKPKVIPSPSWSTSILT